MICMDDRKEFAEMLLWAASTENKDEETRNEAKDMLDAFCYLQFSQARAGRAGSAETAKPKSPTCGMQQDTVRTMGV